MAGTGHAALAALLLVLVAAGVYANSLTIPFTFDDEVAIVGNESIRSLGSALTPPSRGEPVAGRPIVNLSFALNYATGGLDARGFHAVNIALHAGCALLLFGLVRRTWIHAQPASGERTATALACACALLWVVHPLTSETVNYISQRTESLMAFFYLLTLYAGARAAGDAGRSRWLTVAVASCAAGMACKETMATAPLLVWLYDRTFLYGSFGAAWRERRGFYLSLASAWILLAVLIWAGPRWESAGFSTGISPWMYLLNQAVMLVEYLRRVVWPRSLVLDYGEPEVYALGAVAPHAALVVVLLALTIWALVKRPMLGFLGAAFFVILAPTSSIIPIATEVGAERRLYLPLAALLVLAVVVARWALARTAIGSAAVAMTLVGVVTAGLSAATVQRNAEYLDGLTLWQHTLERWPTSRAHRNLATMLKRAGRGEEALTHMRQAVTDHPEGRYALGYELVEQGKHAEAVTELTRFLADFPESPESTTAHSLMATAYVAQQQYGRAAEHYQAIANRQPQNPQAWITLGVALGQADQLARAEEALRKGTALAPRDSSAHMLLGLVLATRGATDEARAQLRMAIELDPSNAEARGHLAQLER